MNLSKRQKELITFTLDILIIIDIFLLIFAFFNINLENNIRIIIFDFIVCILMLIEFGVNCSKAANKKEYTRHHIIDLIASIPFDIIFAVIFMGLGFTKHFELFGSLTVLRFLRIFRFVRVAVLIRKYSTSAGRFLKNSYLDKILSAVAIVIIIFTILLYLFSAEMHHDPLRSQWFVIVTLTTVGYGDITITNFSSRLLALLLIITGVFVFSTITGAISSIFTDKLLKEENVELRENLHILNQKMNFNEIQLEKMNKQVEESNRTTNELKEEIQELKKIIKEK
ncbi:ion transporter [uncultured Methanobrevibacter sp.]|uniref:ion transporter n=1 Tax=uncultured Methanobrevibacter sp. TaxID=253161 RepID=UPI0025FC8CAC|nr:ion transporter [uncultured Methanobrevibacter sp.]